jgi:hypothetical protein
MKRIFLSVLATAAFAAAGHAAAQGFALEGAVIDSRNGNSLGVVTERGELAALFRAQKAMTFGILRSAGISLDQLSPEVRARIERFQTTSVDAFRAFSQGLDLKDQGKFAEAREFFRRAAELDPSFALAAEQQQSMPDVNLTSAVQLRAVIAAASGAAVDRGKATYVVDLARAVAAVQAGQTVVLVPAGAAQTTADYTANPAGSSGQFLANQSVGLVYNFSNSANQNIGLIASAGEWRADDVRLASGGTLETLGSTASGFIASRANAATANTGSLALADGTVAYWGSWLSTPTNSASISASGSAPLRAPTLGPVDWLVAEAPRVMPGSGTATYTPAGGPSMSNVTGNIGVNFANRQVTLQNLGFQTGGLTFSGLNGQTNYAANSAAGAFTGNYSSGLCTGCVAFNPQSSSFAGSFAGAQAQGLLFSTFLLTGSGTAAGTHLFTRP